MKTVMIAGVPMRMSIVPSKETLRAMTAAQRISTARNPDAEDKKAAEYVKFICNRDGVIIPEETTSRHAEAGGGCGIRLVVVRDWPKGASHNSPRAVEWQKGVWCTFRKVLRWRRRKGVAVQIAETEDCRRTPFWETEEIVLHVEIPHWNWKPVCVAA